MTELQEEILNRYIPEYEDIKYQLEGYSEYELSLVRYNLPDDIEDLQNYINKEIQWDIIGDLCSPFIENWDNLYESYEGEIMDLIYDSDFISYNSNNNSYELCKDAIINLISDLFSEIEENYTINEEVDFSKVIAYLNEHYPVKFCEV